MAFWLETKTEYWDALPVQYLRRTGAYGKENAALMAEMKNRITKKRALAGRYYHMGSALGQSPYNTAPFVPLRCMHPRAVGFTCPNTSRRKISHFYPAPHHRSPCPGMGRLF